MNRTLIEFTSELASKAPVPGGGGAAALVGAIGTALGNMVGSLTVGKKKYAAVEEEIIALKAQCDNLQKELLNMISEDAMAFEPLAKAYAIPKDDPSRADTLEQATLIACQPPLRIMELCCESIRAVSIFAEKGSRLAVSDAGCAAIVCLSALKSAALNVFINTKSLRDREKADEINRRADEMLSEYGAMAEKIYDDVSRGLRQ